MAIPSSEKEARGRRAAESAEKKFEPAFSEQETKDMLDDLRRLKTKESILNLRKKTLEYKTGKKKKKKSSVTEEDMYTKVIV
jgi:hypothetical protein|tara:strand:- start:330 stop:575 length:246 start_codon:yes stop_codon:yes gene_type:complete